MQTFPVLVPILGMKGLFFMSAAASVAGAVFSFLWIPVTKDKSMLELEMLFAPKQSVISECLNPFFKQSQFFVLYW